MLNRLRKIKITEFRKFFSESILIIFSVLFALFINKCQSDSQEASRTDTILLNIRKEMEQNQIATKNLIDYHGSVLTKLKKAPSDSLEHIFFRGNRFLIYDNNIAPLGVTQEVFKDIAWQAAKQENISSRISFERAQPLFEVYHQQENVSTTIYKLLDILESRETYRKELIVETIALMQTLFEEMKAQEEQLLAKYKIALKQI